MPKLVHAAATAAAFILPAIAALPPPAAAQGPRDQVCFYEHADFGGRRMCIAIGQRVSDVGPGFNDIFSSVAIPPGVRATMCENINFGGRCIRLDHTAPNFQTLGAWNDNVSSVAAEPIGPSGPPGPGGGPPRPSYGGPPPGYGGPGFARRDEDGRGRGPDYRGPDFGRRDDEEGPGRGPEYRGPPEPPRGPGFGAVPPPPPERGRDYREYPPPPGPRTSAVPPPPPPPGPRGPGGPPQGGSDQVCFYEHANFAGRSQCTPVGGVVAAVTALNDQFSSVTMPPGVIVIACEDGNFSGRCTQFDRPNPALDSYWNDRISSFRSQRR